MMRDDEIINTGGKGIKPLNNDRVEAYYKYWDDYCYHCFIVEYNNSLIKSILDKYNYTSSILDDPFEFRLDGDNGVPVIPHYAGVCTINELTDTLIDIFVSFGSGDSGLENELNSRKLEIAEAFTSVKGTSAESVIVDELLDEIEYWIDDMIEGYDFEMKNGVYRAVFRKCQTLWQ